MAQSFRGGIRPEGRKITSKSKIGTVEAGDVVRLPLGLPVGEEALVCVEPGDRVLRGQCVAHAAPGLSLPVHSPVSGRVLGVENARLASGTGPLARVSVVSIFPCSSKEVVRLLSMALRWLAVLPSFL